MKKFTVSYKTRFIIYLIFLFLLGHYTTHLKAGAYPEPVKAHLFLQEIDMIDEFSNNAVTAMIQSSDGKYWLGVRNEGLYSFNGLNSTAYKVGRPSQQKSIVITRVFALHEDDQNRIWTFGSGGISRINRDDTVDNWQWGLAENSNLSAKEITSFISTPKLGFFVAGNNQILKYNQHTDSFEKFAEFTTDHSKKILTSTEKTTSMMLNTAGNEIILTYRRSGMYLFNPLKKIFTPINLSIEDTESMALIDDYEIWSAKKIGQKILLGLNIGLAIIDESTGKGKLLYRTISKIRHIETDLKEKVYFGTRKGFIEYNLSSNTALLFINPACSYEFRATLRDNNGAVWLACFNTPYSIYKIPDNTEAYTTTVFNPSEIKNHGTIYALFENLVSKYFTILTTKSALSIEADSGKFQVLNTENDPLSSGTIFNDYLALARENKITVIKHKQIIFEQVLTETALRESVFFSPDGTLWIIAFRGDSYQLPFPYKKLQKMPSWMPDIWQLDTVKRATISPDGKWLTVVFVGSGFYVLNLKNQTSRYFEMYKDYDPSAVSPYFMQSSNDFVNIYGAGKDYLQYNFLTEKINYKQSPVKEVVKIKKTPSGMVYFPYEGYPLLVTNNNVKIPLYADFEADGRLSPTPTLAFNTSSDSISYVAGNSIIVANTKMLINALEPLVLAVDKIKSNGNTLLPKNDHYRISEGSDTLSIELKSNQPANIENFRVNWQFRLGENKKWRELKESKLNFYNQPAGRYRFQLKTIDQQQPQSSIAIVIEPQWFNSVWFKVLAFLLFTSILILFTVYRVRLSQAKKLAKAYGRFAARVSHEMRTPLSSIIHNIKFKAIKSLNKDISISKDNQKILFAAEQMSALLDIMLDDARKAAGNAINLQWKRFEIKKHINGIESMCSFLGKFKKVQIQYHLDKNIPDSFVSDPLRIQQILINLIKNAVDHSYNDSVVSVYLRLDEKDKTSLYYEVIDQGEGMHPDKINEITKQQMLLKSSKNGLGMGLYLSNSYAKALGKGLQITSDANGSRIHFTIHPQKQIPILGQAPAKDENDYG